MTIDGAPGQDELARRRAALSDERRLLLERRLRGAAPAPTVDGIGPATAEERRRPSFAQQRLWFLDLLDPRSPAYNLGFAFRVTGDLDRAALQRAVDAVVTRHEILRTSYRIEDVELVAAVDPAGAVAVEVEAGAEGETDEQLQARAAAIVARRFDLAHGDVVRVVVAPTGPRAALLVVAVHHIAVDWISMGVLVADLAGAYERAAAGQAPDLAPGPLTYADYAAWQRRRLTGAELDRLETFWRGRLGTLGPARPFIPPPADPIDPADPADGAESVPVHVPATVVEPLRELARAERATPFMVVLAAVAVLSGRATGERDVVVASPIAGRDRPELASIVGCFVNTLVHRLDVGGDPTFRELVGRTRDAALGAFAHQDLPFEKLVELIRPARERATNPLVAGVLAFQSLAVPTLRLAGLELVPLPLPPGPPKFPWTLTLAEEAGGYGGTLEVDRTVVDPAAARSVVARLEGLLADVVGDPDRRISGYDLLQPSDHAAVDPLLVDHPAPAAGDRPGTIVGRFRRSVAAAPDAVAVSGAGGPVTYGTLDRWSDAVAAGLRARGVGAEALVGVDVAHSAELVAVLLGVLKAGAAYVPIDPTLPTVRRGQIAERVGVGLVVRDERGADAHGDRPSMAVTELLAAEGPPPDDEPRPANAAYVIETSGSTGTPKATVVTHESVVRLLDATAEEYRLGPADAWSWFHSVAFDFSVWEIWGALLHGARLVVVPREATPSPAAVHDLLVGEEVSVLSQTPSAFALLSAECERRGVGAPPALRLVVFGGEILPFDRLEPWFERTDDERVRLYNMYGITETTVHTTIRRVRSADTRQRASLLGPALPGIGVAVLDRGLAPAPVGVVGELFVRGTGVARGYLHQGGLTAERFVPNPWASTPGARMYRSGDLATVRPDGDLACAGRADDQVKIRGHRVELGEVAAAVRAQPGVLDAVVLAFGSGPDSHLVAYAVLDPATTPAPIAAELARLLPAHLRPSAIVPIPAVPLTANGKVARDRLPRWTEPAAGGGGTAGDVEAVVASVLAELLEVDAVGRDENFFDAGAHSMLLVDAQVRLSATLGIEVPLLDLFTYPTARLLARHLAAADEGAAVSVRAQALDRRRRLRQQQQRRARSER